MGSAIAGLERWRQNTKETMLFSSESNGYKIRSRSQSRQSLSSLSRSIHRIIKSTTLLAPNISELGIVSPSTITSTEMRIIQSKSLGHTHFRMDDAKKTKKALHIRSKKSLPRPSRYLMILSERSKRYLTHSRSRPIHKTRSSPIEDHIVDMTTHSSP
jgi:hypothetical protein